jgi:hypothetical protein
MVYRYRHVVISGCTTSSPDPENSSVSSLVIFIGVRAAWFKALMICRQRLEACIFRVGWAIKFQQQTVD